MSLFDRRTFLIALASLSGCGFQPVYKSGTALYDTILVDAPKTRDEFALVAHLEERLGRGVAAKYGLKTSLNVTTQGLAITGSNDITRYEVLGNASFVLRDLMTGAVLVTDKVDSFTSYSASEQPVATLAAQRDATARLMVVLADKITAKLTLSAGQL